MSIQALVSAITMAVLFEEFAERLPMLQVLVEEGAVFAFFAEALQVIYADFLLVLRRILLLADVAGDLE